MSSELRELDHSDEPELRRLLALRPIENIVVSARLDTHGFDPGKSGAQLLGFFHGDHLVSALSVGSTLQPVNATLDALDFFARHIEQRTCQTILGVRGEAMGLWRRLSELSFTQWAAPRDVRHQQIVMAMTGYPLVHPDRDVQPLGTSFIDSYLDASLLMYTEEVGVAPPDPQGSYRDHVAKLMMGQRAFAVMEGDQVVFKADVVAISGSVCQISGVWLAPEYRGLGLAKPYIASVVAQCLERVSTVSLYVNAHNTPAVGSYLGVGFVEVGEYATIMY
ncbi:MAG: GNAT family N-acetyltransferase [Propionibacteriaceae bacterium]|nr:GNAT family N-acetyltransferase [Propionibacteriaceae bacterium]